MARSQCYTVLNEIVMEVSPASRVAEAPFLMSTATHDDSTCLLIDRAPHYASHQTAQLAKLRSPTMKLMPLELADQLTQTQDISFLL